MKAAQPNGYNMTGREQTMENNFIYILGKKNFSEKAWLALMAHHWVHNVLPDRQ